MIVRVAAGVLRRPDGQILLAQRPLGKIAAGRWEFPGGKIEARESALQALRRELAEEIGIEVTQARPLICLRHAYTERTVELDTWLVTAWQGEPAGLEQQALAWSRPDNVAGHYDILEADTPILNALCLPQALPVTGKFKDAADLLARCEQIFRQEHALLRFRAPTLSDRDYFDLGLRLADQAKRFGSSILVDRPALDWEKPGVAGLQLRSGDLPAFRPPPYLEGRWLFASVHTAQDISEAQNLGVDAMVLGSVCTTATHPNQASLGWDGFSQLVAEAHVPVYAIGGLSESDISRAQQLGAQGIAAVGAYW